MALNEKQKRFISEYLIDLNATQAAIRAGYSEKTAGQIGHELLKKPEIADAIQKANDTHAEVTGITRERVLNELALIGFSSMATYLPSLEKGSLSGLTRDELAVVSEVTIEEKVIDPGDDEVVISRKTKMKLYDKRQALVDLGRHLQLFTDKIDHTNAGQPFAKVVIQMPDNGRS